MQKIRAALEKGGVQFIDENGGGSGVRLRKSPKQKRRELAATFFAKRTPLICSNEAVRHAGQAQNYAESAEGASHDHGISLRCSRRIVVIRSAANACPPPLP